MANIELIDNNLASKNQTSKMNINVSDLKIDQDQYVDLGFNLEFAVDFYRFFKFKNKSCLTSVLITELVLLILISILILPLSLLIFENFGNYAHDTTQFFITILISLTIWLLTNIYLLKQVLKVKSLANLIQSIDQYNQIIKTFNILNQIQSNLPNNKRYLVQEKKLLEVLKITRNSLINALQVEAIFRQKQNYHNWDQLFNHLEENLTDLMSFDLNSNSNFGEYEKLFDETLNIGINIHQEIKKILHKS